MNKEATEKSAPEAEAEGGRGLKEGDPEEAGKDVDTVVGPESIMEVAKRDILPAVFAAKASITSPFLPPDWAETYERLHPGFIRLTNDRLNKEIDHRHECQKKEIDHSFTLARSGQNKTFWLAFFILIIAAVALFRMNPIYGTIIIGLVILSLGLSYLLRRFYPSQNEPPSLFAEDRLKKLLADVIPAPKQEKQG